MIPASELIIRPDGSLYHLHLSPGQVASTIITVGDPERVARVSERFDRVELRVEAREFVTHTGELNGKRLTVISTGIGTDNVDIVLNELDAMFNIDLQRRTIKDKLTTLEFIRLGTSGSFQPDLALDTFLLSEGALAADGLLPFYPGTEGDNTTGKALEDYLTREGQAFPVPPVIVHPELPPALARATDLPRGITMSAAGFYAPQGRSLRLPSALHAELLTSLRKWRHAGTRITNIEMETSGLYGLANALGHRAASLSVLLANRAEGTFSTQGKASVDRLIDRGLELIAG
ncbi:nucleoside phosphorylase [Lewinella sp. W8]|uniref:nucleoside phosphorylase n=1 Tax=Lewinella sp. W8 TaxID=2528208 RepID=UPI0010689301|nr:nucleoside phosphorylase [Lewinella sp. W8]MTB53232.1 phosphorylase [Lewinella sp. W8]